MKLEAVSHIVNDVERNLMWGVEGARARAVNYAFDFAASSLAQCPASYGVTFPVEGCFAPVASRIQSMFVYDSYLVFKEVVKSSTLRSLCS